MQYWQYLWEKKHGIFLYLLRLKWLECAEQDDNDNKNWHKSNFKNQNYNLLLKSLFQFNTNVQVPKLAFFII